MVLSILISSMALESLLGADEKQGYTDALNN